MTDDRARSGNISLIIALGLVTVASAALVLGGLVAVAFDLDGTAGKTVMTSVSALSAVAGGFLALPRLQRLAGRVTATDPTAQSVSSDPRSSSRF